MIPEGTRGFVVNENIDSVTIALSPYEWVAKNEDHQGADIRGATHPGKSKDTNSTIHTYAFESEETE